jgi:2-polyprenyl-6-methoxyphenol hydroxylase-like FAD-dependent oxidoreductase
MKHFIFVISFFLVQSCLLIFGCTTVDHPAHVVVIGGGPAGLATAIEAKLAGASVQVVEKRSEYTRPQRQILVDNSIKLLKKWGVSVDQMKVVQINPDESIAIVSIHVLEECLARRAREMNIEFFQGEFVRLNSDQTISVSSVSNSLVTLSYDFLVGADGIHSKTREALGIKVNHLGDAKARAVFVPLAPTSKPAFDISQPIKGPSYFISRIKMPVGSIIFMQSFAPIPLEQLKLAIGKEGWHDEEVSPELIKAFPVDVTLQQAKSFSNAKKSALLVGDTAATASFFRGLGTNTALKTAAAAGAFFRTVQEEGNAAYEAFNQAAKLATDAMIQDSLFLFDYSNP